MRTNKGFTLVEIMVVVAITGLLIAIATPNFMTARRKAVDTVCIANCVTLGELIAVCRLEGFQGDNRINWMLSVVELEDLFVSNGYMKKMPKCPMGEYYSIWDSVYCNGIEGTWFNDVNDISDNYDLDHNNPHPTAGDYNGDGWCDFDDVWALLLTGPVPPPYCSHWQ